MADHQEPRQSARARRQARRPAWEVELLSRLGSDVRQMRQRAGLTLAEVAAAVELDAAYVGEFERGRANISVTNYFAIVRLLDPNEPPWLQV